MIEILVGKIPTNYSQKYTYMEENSPGIEVLVLGNSETLYGINPDYISYKTFNLAEVSQTLDIDYLLLEKYINEMFSLKAIVIPVTYTSFFEILGYGDETWRIRNYKRYFHINPLSDKKKLIKSLSISYSNDIVMFGEYYLKRKDVVNCTPSGFAFDYKAEYSLTDMENNAKKTAERHFVKNREIETICKSYLSRIVNLADKRNIKVFLITPPTHTYYRKYIDTKQLEEMYGIIQTLVSEYNNIVYTDFSDDSDFLGSDFYDSNHLNDKGSEKLSKKVDCLLESKFPGITIPD